MLEILTKIFSIKKELIAKMDRIHILLLLAPNEELEKELEFVEGRFTSLIELANKKEEELTKTEINLLTNDCESVINILDDIKEDLVKEFRVISFLFLDNQKGEVLVYYYERLQELIQKAKGKDNLLTYIERWAPKQIASFMKKLLIYVTKYGDDNSRRLLPIAFIEEHTIPLELNMKKWNELYNTVKFTIKYINCSKKVDADKIKEAFWPLELYYFIVITLSE